MNIAIIYDWIHTFGGAERILLELHNLFPQAPLFTTVYDKSNVDWANMFKIQTSFLQNIPLAKAHHELFPFLTPIAFENFDLSEFDIVISLTSSDAKGIITKPKTLHICYMLTPTRYLWSHENFYLNNRPFKLITKPVVKYLKKWDLMAKTRPDYIISISKTVQKRVKKYYQLDSEIIYPPVSIDRFKQNNTLKLTNDFFLVVSRLVPYKRVDLAILACNKLQKNLVIIGRGRAETHLKSIAGSNILFLSNLTDNELISYYQSCRALIIPSEEDFGIVSVEAQAAGKPVIAYGKGGARETIKGNKTGIFFQKQNVASLIEAILKFEKTSFSKQHCQQNSKLFSRERFRIKFCSLITNYRDRYFKIIN